MDISRWRLFRFVAESLFLVEVFIFSICFRRASFFLYVFWFHSLCPIFFSKTLIFSITMTLFSLCIHRRLTLIVIIYLKRRNKEQENKKLRIRKTRLNFKSIDTFNTFTHFHTTLIHKIKHRWRYVFNIRR